MKKSLIEEIFHPAKPPICAISYVDPDSPQIGKELEEAYRIVRIRRGWIPNLFQAQSLHWEAMQEFADQHFTLLYGSSSLSRAIRELIALAVSHFNHCEYGITHHREAYLRAGGNPVVATRILENFSEAPLTRPERALLQFVQKITLSPASITDRDLEELRKEAFSDREILDIALVASFVNYSNRIALSLGVKLEDTIPSTPLLD